MNLNVNWLIATALSLLGLLLCQNGCETKDNPTRVNSAVVRAGYGLATCHLGMPITELKGAWVKSIDVSSNKGELPKPYLHNRKAGLEIRHDGTVVDAIFVYYRSDDHDPFTGQIENTINGSSTPEFTIRSFGQPSSISVINNPDGNRTDFEYFEKGIAFEYLNKKLSKVTIIKAVLDYDPRMREDIGDTSAYRLIIPGSEKDARASGPDARGM